MNRILAVSPHLDDAVFSAGGFLFALAQAGWRVIVATVFTGNVTNPSGFALACQRDKGLPDEIDYMALRRAEDERACAMIAAEPRHFPLLEAPHRGYRSAPALFGPVLADDPAVNDVAAVVAELVEEVRPSLLLGPLGLGGHVDHLLVRAAVAAAPGDHRLAWWEDWPYVNRSHAPERSCAKAEELSNRSRAAKANACASYRSQLEFQFGGEGPLRELIARQKSEWLHLARGRLHQELRACSLGKASKAR